MAVYSDQSRVVSHAKGEPIVIVSQKAMWLIVAGITIFYLFARSYEWLSAGPDAFAPEFRTYWMTFLYIEFATEIIVAALLWGYMWRTRDRHLDQCSPREQIRRHVTHFVWLLAYGIAIYWGASYFTEQDGTWHQTITRDKDFTPSHVIKFYLSYPIYIITGTGAFLYAKTRLPCFANGWSLSYLLFVIGPFMILPNVGLNAWGHTFWWMEELFVAPLHYGFVFFGWMALAVNGVLIQIFSDLHVLFTAGSTTATAPPQSHIGEKEKEVRLQSRHIAGWKRYLFYGISFLVFFGLFISPASALLFIIELGAIATVVLLIREAINTTRGWFTSLCLYVAGLLLLCEIGIFSYALLK